MEIVSIILNFILSSGLIATLIFYNANKRKVNAEASCDELNVKQNELNIEHQTIQFLQSQLCDAYIEIDKMQQIINQKRDQIIQLIRQTKELEISLIETQQQLKKNSIYEKTNN